MPTNIKQIKPPLGGLSRNLSFQSQEQYTTYDADNVRPRESNYDRLAIGTRPGLAQYAQTGAIQMLETVGVRHDDRKVYWEDTFRSNSMAHYSVLPNISTTLGATSLPTAANGAITASVTTTSNCSFVLPDMQGIDISSRFRLGVYLNRQDPGTNTAVRLFFDMASPGDADNAYYVDLAYTGSYIGEVKKVAAGVVTSEGSTFSAPLNGNSEGWFEIEITGSTLNTYFRGELAATRTLSGGAVTNSRLAVVMRGLSSAAATVAINRVSVDYKTTYPRESARSRVVYGSGGTIYKETIRGLFEASGANMKIGSSGVIEAVDSGQKLWIADNPAPILSGSDGVLTATTFDAPSVSSWASSLVSNRRGDLILQVDPIARQATSGLLNTTYYYPAEVLASVVTSSYYGNNPSIKVVATNGNFTLSGVTDLTFASGDGTADTTMQFSSSAATPELRRAALASALTNSYFTAVGSASPDAEISVTVIASEFSVSNQFVLKNPLNTTGNPASGNPLEAVTNFDIDAVAAGNLTIHAGPSTTVSGASWRIIRCPKVYDVVADEEAVVASGTDGAVTGGNTFDSATYSNWKTTLAGKDLSKYDVQILSGGVITTAYPILSIAAGGGTIGIGTATNATGLTFQIARNDALVRWRATRGDMPVGFTMVERYQDRLVVAGSVRDPFTFSMSRIGDPTDFCYTDDDVGGAVKGSLQPTGAIHEPITALMPYNDDNFFFGCRNSLWLLRGNPKGGGRIDNVSYRIGVISKTSWCHGPMGELVWISRDGIWVTNPQCMECEPNSFSREKLPREFLDINPDLYNISMAYDTRDRGIHVFITPQTAGTDEMPSDVRHWFIHWETKSFWPVSFGDKGLNPVLVKYLSAPSPEDTCVLIAGFSGDILRFSRTSLKDHSTAIASYVNFGPMMLNQSGYYRGMLRTLDITMGENSASTTWSLYKADTAEAVATASTAFRTGTFTSGNQQTVVPMMGGSAWRMKIEATSGKFVFEGATALISPLGKDRVYG